MRKEEFYKTRAWRRCRDSYIKTRVAIDGGLCEVCGRDLGKVVHHKVWLTEENVNDKSIALSPDNLRYECQTCHNREKDPERICSGRFTIDADGVLHKAGDW